MKQKDLKTQLAKKRRQAQELNSRIEELIAEEVVGRKRKLRPLVKG